MSTLAALALAAGLLGAGRMAAQTPAAQTELDAERARLAAELATLADGAAPAQLAPRLVALSTEPAALLFDALSRDELPLPEGALVLGERERSALLAAAGSLGRAPFAPLWSAAATAPEAAPRRTAILLIGRLGTASDLETAVQAALAGETIDPESPALLEQAAAQLLKRTREALPALRPLIVHAPPEVASYLVRAVGQSGDGRALAFLVELLGFDESLDLPLLSQLGCAAHLQEPPFEEPVRVRVREYLLATDRQLVRAAAAALAELQDEEAIPALLDLCASSDRALASAAFLALERTTGSSLPRRAQVWQAWLQAEQRWTREEGPQVVEALKGRNVPRTLAGLRDAAAHRLERQRFSELAARLLEHEDAGVRLEACRTLRTLASPTARAALERALSDPAAEVAAAARDALGALPVRARA